jgi:DNA-binding transcriptional ArsR family regulator
MAEYEFLQFPAEAVQVDEAMVGGLPGSAHRVFEALRERGPLTHSQLRDATSMPARTVRFAVQRLKRHGLVDSLHSLRDCRVCYFFVSGRHVGPDALQAARRRAAEAARRGRFVERIGSVRSESAWRPAPSG